MTHVFVLSIFEHGSADMAFSGPAFVLSNPVALLHARSCIEKTGE